VNEPDFISLYLEYTEKTEPPYIYHRWCALSIIAAILGRNFHIQHGHFKVFPNIYCILVGEPGARKSTAIRIGKRLITSTGYSTIAADRTTKEKLLLDLQGETQELSTDRSSYGQRRSYDKTTSDNLWGSREVDDLSPREIYITADEFNEFVGTNNVDFCRMLGQLWDYDDIYRSRIKNGVSVAIPFPTLNILGGITPQDYADTFPANLIGQGFVSRLIHIHGEISGRKFTFPDPPDEEKKLQLVTLLKTIQSKVRGSATITSAAHEMLDEIYKGWEDIPDVRFRHYSNRRFTQLLKGCLSCAASHVSTTVDTAEVLRANTFLSAAERNMPKALGEFGKGKHSAIADKLLRIIAITAKPVGLKDLWKEVHKDLDKPTDLAILIQSLEQADKIHHVKAITGQGWLPKAERQKDLKFVDWKLLSEEERRAL